MSGRASLRELASTQVGRVVLGLFGGCLVGSMTVLTGQLTGMLPLGEPRTLRAPCRDASVTALVPGGEVARDEGGRTGAECETSAPSPRHARLEVRVEKAWTPGRAEEGHRRGCASLTGLGPVGRPPGLGDEACVVTDRGMLPVTTVLVRRGALRVTVRYASAAKGAAAVEGDAVAVARRVTASP
ncbi:hypothetical protein ABZ801_10290 [Actinomadura sp. NPDC047616]|uniref:hypothetical protein n=1 Tax=Actinomadura sp. NPDC047616 TaxID=3155914 RepID=UPI0033D7E1FB